MAKKSKLNTPGQKFTTEIKVSFMSLKSPLNPVQRKQTIENIKSNLLKLAKLYRFEIGKKRQPINLDKAFELFVKNGSGYPKTIPILYYSL